VSRVRVVVVGGGIAGLAAAWEAVALGAEVTVLEQAPRVGGALALTSLATVGGRVDVDAGAEAFLARRPEVTRLAAEVGLAADLVHPVTTAARVWCRGRAWPLPPGTVLGIPASTDGLEGLLTPAEVARVAAERSLPPLRSGGSTAGPGGLGSPDGAGGGGGGGDVPDLGGLGDGGDVAVGELVAERLGDAVVDRLVEPLLGGVYAGRARELSLAAVSPALAAALRSTPTVLDAAAAVASAGTGSALASTGPVFGGIRGGVGRLPAAVAEALRAAGATVRTDTTVRHLVRAGGGWELTTGPTGAEVTVPADAVVLAVGAAPARRLLGTAGLGAAADALGPIAQASVGIVLLSLAAGGALAAAVADTSGILVPPVEGLLAKAATWSSSKWGWVASAAPGSVVLRASVGRAGESAALARPDAEIIAAVLADLETLLGVPLAASVLDARVARWDGALPQYRPGHLDRVRAMRALLTATPGLAVSGASVDGVGIPACIASGRSAARQVIATQLTGALS